MKRVNPADFPAKFQKHNIRPSRSFYVTDEDCTRYGGAPPVCAACALGIEAVDATDFATAMNAKRMSYPVVELAVLAGLDFRYARGLDDGWEGFEILGERDEDYKTGHADGQEAWTICKAELIDQD